MLSLFIGLIIGVIGSWIAGNLLPPVSAIANWYAKRTIKTIEKRIQSLEFIIERDRLYMNNTTSFVAYIAKVF